MLKERIILEAMDETVKNLTMINIMRTFQMITEEEQTKAVEKIRRDKFYLDFCDELADIAYRKIIEYMNSKLAIGEKYRIKFDERVIVWKSYCYEVKGCDMMVISDESLLAVNIISNDYDLIELEETEDIVSAAYGILDKYGHKTKSKTIDFAVVQPNLQSISCCTLSVDDVKYKYKDRLCCPYNFIM